MPSSTFSAPEPGGTAGTELVGRGLSMAEAAGDPSADAGHSADSIQRVRDARDMWTSRVK